MSTLGGNDMLAAGTIAWTANTVREGLGGRKLVAILVDAHTNRDTCF